MRAGHRGLQKLGLISKESYGKLISKESRVRLISKESRESD